MPKIIDNKLTTLNQEIENLNQETIDLEKSINVDLHQWFTTFLINILQTVLFKVKLCKTNNYLNNYTNNLSENLKSQKYDFVIMTIFVLMIFRYAINKNIF